MICNPYYANTVSPGDIFVLTLKVTIQYNGTYRIYRCPWPHAEIGEDGSPQGDKFRDDEVWVSKENGRECSAMQIIAESLMHVLTMSDGPDFSR